MRLTVGCAISRTSLPGLFPLLLIVLIHKNTFCVNEWANSDLGWTNNKEVANVSSIAVSFKRNLRLRESLYEKHKVKSTELVLTSQRLSYQQFHQTSVENDCSVIFLLAFSPCRQKSISERDLWKLWTLITLLVFRFFSNEQLISKCALWLITTLGLIGLKCSRMPIILMQIWIYSRLNPLTWNLSLLP